MSDISTLLPSTANSNRAEAWAPLIAKRLRASAENIIEAGRLLIEAKAACEHGEFLRLFNDHSNPVDGCLSFGSRTGEMISAVARCSVIANPNHGSILPSSWRTLYELSRLPEPDLIDAIESGRVTPELKRSDVRKLITDESDDSPQVKSEPSKVLNLMDLIAKTRETIAALAEEFGEEHKLTLASILRQEAKAVEGEQGGGLPVLEPAAAVQQHKESTLPVSAITRAMRLKKLVGLESHSELIQTIKKCSEWCESAARPAIETAITVAERDAAVLEINNAISRLAAARKLAEPGNADDEGVPL